MPRIDAARIIATPDGFATAVLGMDLYPKQREVLRALAPAGSAVSFRSCNEGGKTRRVICGAILWHLSLFPKGHVISTSGSYRQIKDQLLPALHAYSGRFPRWNFLHTPRIETESINCFWEGFSTNDAGKFEGHHADGPDQPLLIIVDEAKTVKDDIFQAIERCKATRLLIASSPGYAEGEFYRSHTTGAKFWKTFVQRATDCPHWKPEDIARLREKWGADHPLYQSMVEADFMESVADAVIDLKALEDLQANLPNEKTGERKAFCDFAWGGDGDENVMALRDGNKVTLEECFRADNLHAICGRFIAAFSKHGLQAGQIDGDEGGGGKLIIDQLQAMGWRINRVNNGEAARFDGHYANLAAEMWYEGAKQIARREVILPDDDDLRAQMLDRKRIPHAKGKLAVESKREMKQRGVRSPDRADAVFGAMTPVRRLESFSLGSQGSKGSFTGQLRDFNETDEVQEGQLPGAYFG
jgi:hypothetical protein